MSTHNVCFEQNKISEFSSENFQFLVMKFSIYLNRRVVVMNNALVACSKLFRAERLISYLWAWAWWAKLAYQVMLTIRGRLITPFVLGSMSVGLTILIRHSFMDL